MSRLGRVFLMISSIAALMTAGLLVMPVSAGSGEDGRRSAGGITVFGKNIHLTESVNGSVQVVFGSARIDASVGGDVLVFGGDIVFGPEAFVEGDVISFGGEVMGLNPARVRGRLSLDRIDSVEGSQLGMTVSALNDPFSIVGVALKLTLLAGWLLAALVLSVTSGREIRASSLELRSSPLQTFILGLVAFTSLVLTAIVFSYLISLVVGIPLLVCLGVFAILTKIYGMVAVFHAVGTLLVRTKTRDESDRRRWLRGDMAMVTIGLVVIGLLRLIPFVGNVLWMGCSLLGVGVALSTKFGRREPWFLAWRPATEAGSSS